jgi:phage gp36-like protein
MSYADLADLQQWIDEDKLIRLTDDAGLDAVNESIVSTVLEAASVEIDGYLGAKYSLPFASPPAILTKLNVDIAGHLLHIRREGPNEYWQSQYENAITFLKLVNKGLVSLGVGDPEGSSQNGTVNITSSTRVFNRTKMEGF